jgi:hypothetical protein
VASWPYALLTFASCSPSLSPSVYLSWLCLHVCVVCRCGCTAECESCRVLVGIGAQGLGALAHAYKGSSAHSTPTAAHAEGSGGAGGTGGGSGAEDGQRTKDTSAWRGGGIKAASTSKSAGGWSSGTRGGGGDWGQVTKAVGGTAQGHHRIGWTGAAGSRLVSGGQVRGGRASGGMAGRFEAVHHKAVSLARLGHKRQAIYPNMADKKRQATLESLPYMLPPAGLFILLLVFLASYAVKRKHSIPSGASPPSPPPCDRGSCFWCVLRALFAGRTRKHVVCVRCRLLWGGGAREGGRGQGC